jgi:membrane protease YdiL (CAAX protease family)
MLARSSGKRRWAVATVLALAAAGLAGSVAWREGWRGAPLVGAVVALVLLFVPYFGIGLSETLARSRAGGKIVAVVGLLLVPYFVYAVSTGTLTIGSLARLGLYLAVPTALCMTVRRGDPRARWQDGLAVLALWLPHELGWMASLWSWPEGRAGYLLQTILEVDFAVVVFVIIRGLDGVGYRFRLKRADLRTIVVNFAIFVAIAIPVGLATGFVSFRPRPPDLPELGIQAVGIFLAIAIPEELLFRGIVQNLLQRLWGNPPVALLVASLVFGASHLNNGPHPDWRYFLLATIAGLFYGRAYLQSRGLMAPACVHALVDLLWRSAFR